MCNDSISALVIPLLFVMSFSAVVITYLCRPQGLCYEDLPCQSEMFKIPRVNPDRVLCEEVPYFCQHPNAYQSPDPLVRLLTDMSIPELNFVLLLIVWMAVGFVVAFVIIKIYNCYDSFLEALLG